MKYWSGLWTVLTLCSVAVDSQVSMEIYQYAIDDFQMTNTLDNCYFAYGTPKISMREYDSTSGEFQGDAVWHDVCTFPWTRNEHEVFCRAFGFHTMDASWDFWSLLDSLFSGTGGCDVNTDASVADCNFDGNRVAPICDSTTGTSDAFYSSLDTNNYIVRPAVYCQIGHSRIDPVQCLHSGNMVEYSEPLFWKLDGKTVYSSRRKRDVSDRHIEATEPERKEESQNTEKVQQFGGFRQSNNLSKGTQKDTRKNILLMDPLKLEAPIDTVDEKDKDDILAFWALANSHGLDKQQNIFDDDSGNNASRIREKRDIAPEIYCGTRNVVVKFRHSTECKCTDGYTGEFCEDDIDECLQTPSVCDASVKCTNIPGSYMCECPAGFERNSEGNCIDVNECLAYNGGCTQNCDNFDGGFDCSCNSGYSPLNDGRSCQDIDECESSDLNLCDSSISTCRNTFGTYRCICLAGYENDNFGFCQDIDECSSAINPCQSIGANSECTNTIGFYSCSCGVGEQFNDQGVCQKITTIKVRVPIRLPRWNVNFENPESAEHIKLCEKVKVKARVGQSSFSVSSSRCIISRRNNARRKRQDEPEVLVDVEVEQVFEEELTLAEQSQATNDLQTNLADGVQEIDIGIIDGVDYGNAGITGRAELVEAPGVDLQNVDMDITDICYLYNQMSFCKSGSVCVEGDGGLPTCDCPDGYIGDSCDEQVVSSLSTTTIFLLAACIGLFLAVLGLCFSHIYHLRKLRALETFVGYRYHVFVGDDRHQQPSSTMADSVRQPRGWLPQPVRRYHTQQPAYFSHWN